ncbi:MAG: hypothetical protein L0L69_04680 [Propionibacterium sp.]|nr:hypothetical protein [Propionibacterium sp.]
MHIVQIPPRLAVFQGVQCGAGDVAQHQPILDVPRQGDQGAEHVVVDVVVEELAGCRPGALLGNGVLLGTSGSAGAVQPLGLADQPGHGQHVDEVVGELVEGGLEGAGGEGSVRRGSDPHLERYEREDIGEAQGGGQEQRDHRHQGDPEPDQQWNVGCGGLCGQGRGRRQEGLCSQGHHVEDQGEQ